MKRVALAVVTLLVSATIAQTAPAASAQPSAPNPHPYTMLYVFGDSYSDSGSGYRDTNGPTAVAVLAQRLGIPFTYYGDPKYSKTEGLNFAISGAGSGAGNGRRYPTGQMLGIGMKNQVDNFVAFSKTKDIPPIDAANTMFFFAGGLNDRGAHLPGCPAPVRMLRAPAAQTPAPAGQAPAPTAQASPAPVAQAQSAAAPPAGCEQGSYTRTNIEDEIETLYAIGARRFMVGLLPTKIPQFASAGTMFNPELSEIPAEELAKHPDIRIATSDWVCSSTKSSPTRPNTASPTPSPPAPAATSTTKTPLPALRPTHTFSTTKAIPPPLYIALPATCCTPKQRPKHRNDPLAILERAAA